MPRLRRKRYSISQQTIQRKVENFKLREVLDRLDGNPRFHAPGALGSTADAFEALLQAGIKPTQHDIATLRAMPVKYAQEYVRRLVAGDDFCIVYDFENDRVSSWEKP